MSVTLVVLTSLGISWRAPLVGQDSLLFSTRVFTTADGLPDRRITAVTQDSSGRIWFGTRRGLVKFDGEDFQAVALGDKYSVTEGIISVRTTTADRLLILRSQNEGLYFDPATGRVTEMKPLPQQYASAHLRCVNARTGHQLYQTTDKQLILRGATGEVVKIVYNVDGIKGQAIDTPWSTFAFFFGKPVQLAQLDTVGVVRWTSDFWKDPHIVPLLFADGNDRQRHIQFRTTSVRKMLERFYVLEESGNIRKVDFTGIENLTDRAHSSFSYNVVVARDSEDKFWIATKNTLWVFDRTGKLLRDLSAEVSDLFKSTWSTIDILADREGNIWLATTRGVVLVSQQKNPFRCYLTEGNDNSIRGLTELRDGRLLMGAKFLTQILDPESDRVEPVGKVLSLGFGRSPQGKIVSGCYGPQLQIFSDSGEFQYRTDIYATSDGYSPSDLTVPYFDELTGALFCGSSTALFHRPAGDSLLSLYRPPNDSSLFVGAAINHLERHEDGLWVAGRHGLYRIGEKEAHLAYHLPGALVKHFYRTDDGDFWLATDGVGLVRWSPTQGSVKQYTTVDGLSSNVIYAVYGDEFGYLWLPSENGLMQLDLETESVRIFLPEDGIAHEEFNTFSHLRASDGRFYFGGIDGLTSFYPADIAEVRTQKPIALTGIRKFNRKEQRVEDLLAAYREKGRLILPPDERDFTVRFALRDYTAEAIDYAWRLEPNGGEWTYQKDNEIRINGLDYGAQQLVVKARGNGSYWTPEPLRINLFAQRPFYQRWPFWLFAVATSALLVWAYVRRRTQRLVNERRRLTETVAERTRELAARNEELTAANQMRDRLLALISHDLRAPIISLRGISRKVRFLVSRERFGEVDRLSSSIDTTVANTQHLLDNLLAWAASQRRMGQPVTQTFNLADAVTDTVNLFMPIAAAKGVALAVDCPPEAYAKADPAAIATILRNLVDNAVKFSPQGGGVNLSVTQTGGYYAVRVGDSGPGIKQDLLANLFVTEKSQSTRGTAGEKGIGLGLPLSHELARINGGDLLVRQTDHRGTVFELTVPAA